MRAKASALWWLAARTWRRVGALYIAGVIVAAVCLVTSMNAYFDVQAQKGQPSRLTAAAENITDATILAAQEIEDVTDVTGVIDVPTTVTIGRHSAELTVRGVEADFFDFDFAEGEMFPESSAMPYIVLNEGALKAFTGEGAGASDDAPPDWKGQTAAIGAEKPLTVKICGIIDDGDEVRDAEGGAEPVAYMSTASAKTALLHEGVIPAYSSMLISVRDMGSEEGVIRELARLGIGASPTDPARQAEWARMETELTYLLLTGLFALICASAIGLKTAALDLTENRDEYAWLAYMGLSRRDVNGVMLRRHMVCTAAAVIIGAAVQLAVPSFVEAEYRSVSIFACAPRWGAYAALALAAAAECAVFGWVCGRPSKGK